MKRRKYINESKHNNEAFPPVGGNGKGGSIVSQETGKGGL